MIIKENFKFIRYDNDDLYHGSYLWSNYGYIYNTFKTS